MSALSFAHSAARILRKVGNARDIAGLAVLFALGLAVFLPLLRAPDRFPVTGDSAGSESPRGREAAARAVADALLLEAWERSTGEISYLDPDLTGRNRAADPSVAYTHPLCYTFSRALPPGLSMTLVALIHALLLSGGSYLLARRIGMGPGPAFFAGAASAICGGALSGLVAPDRFSVATAAALVPATALLADSILRRPSLPRTALLSIAVCGMASGGNLTALTVGGLLAAAGAAVLRAADPPAKAAGFRGPAWSRGPSLVAGGALLGIILPAYRSFPLAFGGPGAVLSIDGLVSGPWWTGATGGLRLPFFFGSVTLVAIAAAMTGHAREPRVIAAAAGSVLFAALSPPALLPFVGIPIAFAAALGAMRLARILPARLPVAGFLTAGLILEAAPYHGERMAGLSGADVAAAPRWVELLARIDRGERAAVLGEDGSRHGPALALRGVLRVPGPGSGDLSDFDSMEEIRALGARTIVSELPDARKRLPLLHVDRAYGKYFYANPGRLGPAWWTASDDGESATRGTIRTLSRTANGFRLDVDLPVDARIVIAEPAMKGTDVTIDGVPARVLEAGPSRIVLDAPAGAHQVRAEFQPPGLATGSAVSALALACIPFLLAAPAFAAIAERSRRRRDRTEAIRRAERKEATVPVHRASRRIAPAVRPAMPSLPAMEETEEREREAVLQD
jgi:hypothetical protein